MRILYLDIDCLRPDHLGCYGYHRATSPAIDAVAEQGVRMDGVYVSDAPCLPSRTAMFSGRFGIHTGVIGHGGTAAEMFIEGPERGFSSLLGRTSWARCLRERGLRTATVSSFGERHSAWHFYANFNDVINIGRRGLESADELAPAAIDWLERRGGDDNWFLHVNLWDPHTPYRAPADEIARFADEPLPAWYTPAIRTAHWNGCGPHSARETIGFSEPPASYLASYPRQPTVMDSMDAVRAMFDGYDAGVAYADRFVGQILDTLRALDIYDDTAILISADHGENLGELNIYGDHHTADEHTCRVPVILRWPGVTDTMAGTALSALHYQVDVAATIIELLGGTVPAVWDGSSFARSLRAGEDTGRHAVVVSQGAWTCQRAVRFRADAREWLCIRSYHDGYHGFPDVMLFDVGADPHEQHNRADDEPAVVAQSLQQLERWHADMMRRSGSPTDPMWTVLAEGGPRHVRGELPAYLDRLRRTGRDHWAQLLASRHSSP